MDKRQALIERLRREIFDERENGPGLRFTQDCPILPDIWEAFAKRPGAQADLIISPFKGENAGAIARDLRNAFLRFEDERARQLGRKHDADDRPARRAPPRIAHIPGLIVTSVYFDHLVTLILPSTRWWSVRMTQLAHAVGARGARAPDNPLGWPENSDFYFDEITGWIEENWGRGAKNTDRTERYRSTRPGAQTTDTQAPYDLLKLIRIVGIMELSRRSTDMRETLEPGDIVSAFISLFGHRTAPLLTYNTVWGASLNRPAKHSVMRSTKAMKADAGRRLFDLTGHKQRWAVIDSGIDGRHPAFSDWRRRNFAELSQTETPRPAALTETDCRPSRLLRTYDFDGLRELLDVQVLSNLLDAIDEIATKPDSLDVAQKAVEDAEVAFGESIAELRQHQQAGTRLAEIDKAERALRVTRGHRARTMGVRRLLNSAALRRENDADPIDITIERGVVEALLKRLEKGLEIDWGAIEFLIEDVDPPAPMDNHGTNVAAILGANWMENYTGAYGQSASGVYPAIAESDGRQKLCGVCPDIELMDFRVVTETDSGIIASHDFEVIAAMKLLNYLNRRSDNISIHGANLSIAIEHNVRSFACGRTPICEECERLVSSGVVVVAAAGNSGYAEASEISDRFYRHASIADPGNAEAVITVGATHRSKPHEFGVSYFSSRGPTGDGRTKPDLVAPGEKIRTATLGEMEAIVDGTSFSAPHVAGAAALLMERHSELVGQPQKIKAILCNSATDLGRERDFQGAGMLDVLRALQSI